MNTVDEFVELVSDELGLPLAPDDLRLTFDQLPGWNSVQLLTLMVALERSTARRVRMTDVLTATSLYEIYALVSDSEAAPLPRRAER
ncbi:acyl carrier protein [Pseudofrankia inefficax]|uniref:Carrier domain-containing protein n=1 Tax=Pseudofrankia inefficax (strain DSM 45817 / CECT 9037 / DDB 130130 / EuI1c) TaxID=298654 RepID=E3JBT8_PSEI1|nr:acyl carrier protein [Pseudofrankia inefficax]ADP82248.1 hypothetical protein FraEuI1c_4249 [Pseudofrankia inefficax]